MTRTFTWTAQIGTHTFKAVVDPNNMVTEDDENNNEKTMTISVFVPDLLIETITWTPAKPSKGDEMKFTATVKNQGTGTAGPSSVYFYVDGSSIGSQAVPEIEAGATANTTFTWTAQGDSHAIKAVADPDNDIKESQETNNEKTMTLSVLVSPASAPKTKSTPAPGQTPAPTPKPTVKPAAKPTPTPEAGKASPLPSLGKGLWLDILFVLVLVALVGTLIRGLMRPKQQ